ncbi:hypothetical protein ES703_71168 [subsurface metagenome]
MTGFAASTLNIKREPTWGITPHPSPGDSGKKLANRSKGAGIGDWITARGTPDRRLVNIDYLVNMLHTNDSITIACPLPRSVKYLCQLLIHSFIDKGALTTTRNPGDTNKLAQGDMNIYVFQVILLSSLYYYLLG